MKKKVILFSSIGGAVLIAAIILIILLCLPKNKAYRTIKVFDVVGTVNIKRDNSNISATKDLKLKNNDVVEVKENSSTVLKLDNDKFIMAKENTTLKLKATGKANETKTQVLIDKGGVVVEVKEKLKEKESFEIASSNSVMAIRGTLTSADVEEKDGKTETNLKVLHGEVDVTYFAPTDLIKSAEIKSSVEAIGGMPSVIQLKNLDKVIIETLTNYDDKKTPEQFLQTLDKQSKITKPQIITQQEAREKHNIVVTELTSSEIDELVNVANDFERKEDEQLNGVIKFSNKPDSVEYGIDPSTLITPDKDYGSINYYYSYTENGEFNLTFDELNPFELGDIYFKAVGPNAYRSDIYKLSIVSRNMTMQILSNQKSNYGTATMSFELDKYDDIFTKDFAKELAESNGESKYKYYIKLQVSDHELNETLIIDYDHKSVMMPFIYSSLIDFSVTATYNLPNYFTVDASETYSFELEKVTDLNDLVICCDRDTTNSNNVVSILCQNYFVGTANTEDQIKVYLIDRDAMGDPQYLPVETLEEHGRISFNVNTDQAEIAIGSFESDTEYKEFELDFTYSNTDNGTTISSYGNSLITYNSDNTMNAYFDGSFTSISNGVKYLAYIYAENYANNIMSTGSGYVSSLSIGSNQKYLVFEDLLQASYVFGYICAVTEYNDIYYVVKRAGGDDIYIEPITMNSSLAALVADEPEVTTTINSLSSCFDTSKPITLENYEGTKKYTVSSDCLTENGFADFIITDDVYSNLYMSATIYSKLDYLEFDGVEDHDYITDDIFGTIKTQFKSKTGVDIKGSNKTEITRHMIQGV